ncbi:NifU family protein [Flavobacterium agricola]|uniref:NifU family protein n=1 Tax=Flavobacterium agricola TaxID=2870839 RepID=A0ABY6LX07_9FLAO|nr:NifU family protein [Flavobacterium agricola]UYW00749.1 NifU family protein [Flavobacterium agricola]
MFKVTIKETQNPTIIKFEFPDFITRSQNFEYKNIDETKSSPLAKKLFFLPFVKTVYISANFVAVERFSIVEWSEVQDEVAKMIEEFIEAGGKVIDIDESSIKKIPIEVYSESTPNPSVLKFGVNKKLTSTHVECKNIDEAAVSPLAKALFNFNYVKEVFIDENVISVTKYDVVEWMEVTTEIRSFIKKFIEEGNIVVDEDALIKTEAHVQKQDEYFDNLDVTSQQIINILEEYVKPAVQSDGGNIAFKSYNDETKMVHVILQGACSGCPSSTFTLKNGIENMLRQMLNNNEIVVEATNA